MIPIEEQKWKYFEHKGENHFVFKIRLGANTGLPIDEERAFKNKLNPCSFADDEIVQYFVRAMTENNLEKVRQIINEGKISKKAINSQGHTALHLAVELKNLKLVELLLEKGWIATEVDLAGVAPFHEAARMGLLEILTALYNSKKFNPDLEINDRSTALYLAAKEGHTKCVKKLIGWNATVDKKNNFGLFPLFMAIYYNHIETALVLADCGVGINLAREDYTTPLHLATEKNFIEVVAKLIEKGADMTLKRRDGATPLHIAAKRGYIEIARLLLRLAEEKKVKIINNPTSASMTPLHYAAQQGHTELITVLLMHGADVSARSWDENTAIMHALENGKEGAAIVLASKTKPETLVSQGESLITQAIQYGLFAVVDEFTRIGCIFMKSSANQWAYLQSLTMCGDTFRISTVMKNNPELLRAKIEIMTLVEVAIIHKQVGVLHILEKFGALSKIPFDTMLSNGYLYIQEAVKNGLIHVVREYFNAPNPDHECKDKKSLFASEKSLAYLAAENGQLQALKVILQNSGFIENGFRKRHVLYAAIQSGSLQCTDYILGKYALDSNMVIDEEDKLRPADLACHCGNKAMLKLLYERGARLSEPNENGHLPIYFALKASAFEVISFFLDKRYKLNMEEQIVELITKSGKIEGLLQNLGLLKLFPSNLEDNLLLKAIASKKVEMVKLLINLEANVNEPSASGKYPLHQAAEEGVPEILYALIEQNANIDIRYNGKNALHLACEKGHLECVIALLLAGINPQERDNEGLDCFDHAKSHPEILFYLNNRARITQVELQKLSLVEAILSDDPTRLKNFFKENPWPLTMSLSHELYDGKITPFKLAFMSNKTRVIEWLREQQSDLADFSRPNETILHNCVRKGEVKLLESAIQTYKANIHTKNAEGEQAIHIAAKEDNAEVMKYLISKGADLYSEDDDGMTPLLIAIASNKMEMIHLILENPYDINRRNYKLVTPLYKAAEIGNWKIVEHLIKKGADVNAVSTFDGRTPLHVAIEHKHDQIVLRLLAAGAELGICDRKKVYPIHLAATVGNKDIILSLYSKDPNCLNVCDHEGKTALHYAALSKKSKALRCLLELNANPNLTTQKGEELLEGEDDEEEDKLPSGVLPFHLACQTGDLALVKKMMERTEEINNLDSNQTGCLGYAVKGASLKVTEYLSNTCIFADHAQILRALVLCTAYDYDKIAEFLFSKKVPVNIGLSCGSNLLHIAAQHRSINSLEILLKNGIHVHARNSFHQTPIQLAVKKGNLTETMMLLEHGAIQDEVDKEGNSLVHLAVKYSKVGVMLLLILWGSEFRSKNHEGYTPLALAAKQRSLECFKYLLYTEALPLDNLTELLESYPACSSVIKSYEEFIKDLQEGDSLLHAAVRKKNNEIFYWLVLVSDFEAVNAQEEAPLLVAIKTNNLIAAHHLLKQGADLGAKDSTGMTALELGLTYGTTQMIEIIKRRLTEISLSNPQMILSLIELIKTNSITAFEALVSGLPASAADASGNQINLILLLHNQINALEVLFKTGVLPAIAEVPNKKGDYPLHVAVAMGSPEALVCLLKYTKNKNPINADGFTPLSLDLQQDCKNEDLLIKAGCELNYQHSGVSQLTLSIKKVKLQLFNNLLSRKIELPEFVENPNNFWRVFANSDDIELSKILFAHLDHIIPRKTDALIGCFKTLVQRQAIKIINYWISEPKIIVINPLKISLQADQEQMVRLIYTFYTKALGQPTKEDAELLALTVESNQIEKLSAMLYTVNISMMPEGGWKPVERAVSTNNAVFCKYLFWLGISALVESDGMTLLEVSVKANDKKLVDLVKTEIKRNLPNSSKLVQYAQKHAERIVEAKDYPLSKIESFKAFISIIKESQQNSQQYTENIYSIVEKTVAHRETPLLEQLEKQFMLEECRIDWFYIALNNTREDMLMLLIKIAERLNISLKTLAFMDETLLHSMNFPTLKIGKPMTTTTLYSVLVWKSAQDSLLGLLDLLTHYGNIHELINERSILFEAIQSDKLVLIEWLLNYGANPFSSFKKKDTAFTISQSEDVKKVLLAWRKNLVAEVVKVLGQQLYDQATSTTNPLFQALMRLGASTDPQQTVIMRMCLVLDSYYSNRIEKLETSENRSKKTQECHSKMYNVRDLNVRSKINLAFQSTRFSVNWDDIPRRNGFCDTQSSCLIF